MVQNSHFLRVITVKHGKEQHLFCDTSRGHGWDEDKDFTVGVSVVYISLLRGDVTSMLLANMMLRVPVATFMMAK